MKANEGTPFLVLTLLCFLIQFYVGYSLGYQKGKQQGKQAQVVVSVSPVPTQAGHWIHLGSQEIQYVVTCRENEVCRVTWVNPKLQPCITQGRGDYCYNYDSPYSGRKK